ncbi:RNA methyltransferase [Paracrocinitomix mangrovi]|uniref:RNA methyltransferase n=1 Tax=Paracrocinitomix mangrovi TaxID=2862509 RepID=UPI001C8D7C77|nr:RNA methyltransferase [Paracrocinitomix mangrovi]UKN01125.1 RNA methyltransferase [Paracrocinitomix mangrovi]
MNRKLKLQELGRMSIEEFKDADKTPLIVILDNIRSLNNVGSVFRTSDCFRVAKIFLCGITATPPHRDIHKTAIGATESVEWEYSESTLNVVKSLQEKGWSCYAIEQTADSISLDDFNPDGKTAIVMGNEVDGVQQEVIDACKGSIEVPQFGTKHSLNISVCTGIVVWDLWQKLSQ